MSTRDALQRLHRARSLAQSGRHAAVVADLGTLPPEQLERSPTLALLFGTAHARLGRHDEGQRWVELALVRARERGDHTLEVRALNVCGAIALDGGRIAEAETFFTRVLEQVAIDSDHAVLGRCAANLGIIANMRGDHDQAVVFYTFALTAFQRAGLPWGVVVTHHNLGRTHHDRGDLTLALEMADRAVDGAAAVGDHGLRGQTIAGRAEIRLTAGDVVMAHHEITQAQSLHREVGDSVGESEDMRILAMVQAATGELTAAQATLQDVIARAGGHHRPLLAAAAWRDLAQVLRLSGQAGESREAAHTARALFAELGCVAEARKLDPLVTTLV